MTSGPSPRPSASPRARTARTRRRTSPKPLRTESCTANCRPPSPSSPPTTRRTGKPSTFPRSAPTFPAPARAMRSSFACRCPRRLARPPTRARPSHQRATSPLIAPSDETLRGRSPVSPSPSTPTSTTQALGPLAGCRTVLYASGGSDLPGINLGARNLFALFYTFLLTQKNSVV